MVKISLLALDTALFMTDYTSASVRMALANPVI